MLILLLSLLPHLHASLPEYTPEFDSKRPRNFVFPPLYSFIIPGLDQFIEGQNKWGATHLGLNASSWVLRFTVTANRELSNPVRGLGAIAVQALEQNTRAASLYQSFRTAVSTRESDFAFIQADESMLDLGLAPFLPRFVFSREMALSLPVIAGAIALTVLRTDSRQSDPLVEIPALMTISHMAGYSEELFFRGYLMPVTEYLVRSPWISNTITAAIFGLAHYSPENRFPIIQTVVGFGLGAIVIQNGWGLGKAIAAHMWYDVAVFTAGAFFGSRKSGMVLSLPPISFSF